jgi:hypothetical protein
MNAKMLDAGLLVAWLAAFLIVAFVHPGLAAAMIAWFGAIGLLWYNDVIRHDSSGALRPRWQPTVAR